MQSGTHNWGGNARPLWQAPQRHCHHAGRLLNRDRLDLGEGEEEGGEKEREETGGLHCTGRESADDLLGGVSAHCALGGDALRAQEKDKMDKEGRKDHRSLGGKKRRRGTVRKGKKKGGIFITEIDTQAIRAVYAHNKRSHCHGHCTDRCRSAS